MGGRSQGPHMHVELVRQDLKREPLRGRSFRGERVCLKDNGVGHRSSARLPGAEGFGPDAECRGAGGLGQLQSCPDIPEERGGFGHR
jgi:hypothetical protein